MIDGITCLHAGLVVVVSAQSVAKLLCCAGCTIPCTLLTAMCFLLVRSVTSADVRRECLLIED